MATFPPAALSISLGIVIGETRSGPLSTKRSIASEIVVNPPIPDPMTHPTVVLSSTDSIPESRTASIAAGAMQMALDDAGISGSTIDYINAHGTSTPLGDKAETKAVKSIFGDHAYKVSISSTKSQLGHSLGASGGLELILTIEAINNSLVPPTINLETPDPDCDLDYTPNVAKELEINYAMSNSFGFGGHNASIIVKKFVD